MSRPSLELNWIRKQDKSIPTPNLIFSQLNSLGEYHPARSGEILIGDSHYDLTNGLIIISTVLREDSVGPVIAHEWRHHWQLFNGWKDDGVHWIGPKPKESNARQLHKLFSSSRSEYDALRFEHKFAPSEMNHFRMMILSQPIGILPQD